MSGACTCTGNYNHGLQWVAGAYRGCVQWLTGDYMAQEVGTGAERGL